MALYALSIQYSIQYFILFALNKTMPWESWKHTCTAVRSVLHCMFVKKSKIICYLQRQLLLVIIILTIHNPHVPIHTLHFLQIVLLPLVSNTGKTFVARFNLFAISFFQSFSFFLFLHYHTIFLEARWGTVSWQPLEMLPTTHTVPLSHSSTLESPRHMNLWSVM